MKKYIWLLVGLPGVGKSTWLNNHAVNRKDAVIVSSDTIIEDMCKAEGLTYNEGFQRFINVAQKKFFLDLAEALIDGKDVFVDRTNLTVNSRKKILDLVPAGYDKQAIVFHCDHKIHKERLASRPGKTIPGHVIDQMETTFQMPTVDEGFSGITTINTN